MEPKQLQQELFNQIKGKLPAHLSFVDELCNLLDLSQDSVYRRIRGEKPVTLDEIQLICSHYGLSLDQLLHLKTDSVLFQAPGILEAPAPLFEEYMKEMLVRFKYFNSFKQKSIYYLCKDMPFWYFYLFPAMASFKTFFWTRTINNDPSLANKRFSLKEFPFRQFFELGQQILAEHSCLETVELWNLESINSTISQIAYYRDAGIFESREDLVVVIDSFLLLLDHLQEQATQGRKFMPIIEGQDNSAFTNSGTATSGSIQFYINELILGNNTMVLQLDDKNISMVTYSVLHYLITEDERFCARASDTFQTLLSRSTLISRSGEKDRNRFFNTLREKVNTLRN